MRIRLVPVFLFCAATMFYSCKKEAVITTGDTIVKQDSAYLKHMADSIYARVLIDSLSGTYLVSGYYNQALPGLPDSIATITNQPVHISRYANDEKQLRVDYTPANAQGFTAVAPYKTQGTIYIYRFNNQQGNSYDYMVADFVKADKDSISITRFNGSTNQNNSVTWVLSGRRIH